MLDHLRSKGWPNVDDPDKLAFTECEAMFKLLLKANLIKYAEWDQFYMAAIAAYERSQLRKSGFNV